MLSFMDAYTLWRALPFPGGAFGDELPHIHSDLALADHYVTAVIRFVEEGVFKPVVPNVLDEIDSVLLRSGRLLDDPQAEVRALAQQLHAYAALLRLIYAEYLRQGAEQ